MPLTDIAARMDGPAVLVADNGPAGIVLGVQEILQAWCGMEPCVGTVEQARAMGDIVGRCAVLLQSALEEMTAATEAMAYPEERGDG